MTRSSFRPFALLPGGHLQTLGGVLLRVPLRWPFPSEDVVIEAEDDVKLLLRASWQEDRSRPALLLIHGLEGDDSARYVLSAGRLAFEAGWHVVRMNQRGCGDALEICPRLYNAGLSTDVVAVLRWLAQRASRVALVGFSLGANLSLLAMTRERDRIPEELESVVAVSPPLWMSECADALEETSNYIYQTRFLVSLLASYRKRQERAPERYEAGRERGLRTLRAFDDVITAHYGGYRDAEDYYRTVSPGPRLTDIDRRTLVLAAANDPFIPEATVARWPRSEHVMMEIPASGGHVGFAGRTRAPGWFWAAERILSFIGPARANS